MQAIRVCAYALIVRDDAVLLVEFQTEAGIYFTLPGGGVEAGELLHRAVEREVFEETCARVDVGRLVLAWEYVPARHGGIYGPQQELGLIFLCQLGEGDEPRLPASPDPHQVAVRWVPLATLPDIRLLPRIAHQLLATLKSPERPDILCEDV